MLAFMRHEYDVLVATTIIENGLDIPLANTILINRADRHGLSELYQLRGRVGRSNRRAYAYLLIPPENELTEIARRRLAALKEFSDLGAGFKIAALDLELRGAGNMLGGEQSGHIEAVGFELYTSMLEAAVKELKGESERGAAGHAAQPRHRAAHRRELCAGGKPAAAPLQEDCRRATARPRSTRCARSWKTATARCRTRPFTCWKRRWCAWNASAWALRRSIASAASCRFASWRTRRVDPAHADAAGGAQRQARRAVHAAGRAEVSVDGHAARRSTA